MSIPKKLIQIKLDEPIHTAVREAAKRRGLSISALSRQAVTLAAQRVLGKSDYMKIIDHIQGPSFDAATLAKMAEDRFIYLADRQKWSMEEISLARSDGTWADTLATWEK